MPTEPANDLSLKSMISYLYHSEYYDVAWTHSFGGFFIDANGIKYEYKNPDNWKSYDDVRKMDLKRSLTIDAELREQREQRSVLKNEAIKPELLFHNLDICKKKKPFRFWFERKEEALSIEIIEDVLNSVMVDCGEGGIYDVPVMTNSLFVYDDKIGFYKQILLSSWGYHSMRNNSMYTEQLISRFGVYRGRL